MNFGTRDLAANIVVALVYIGAAKLGLSLAEATAQVTLVWPPTGIAVAALLLLGYRLWPGIWIGAFTANLLTAEPLAVAAGIATGNTLEALAGVYLLRRINFQNGISRIKDAVGFLVCSSVLSTMVSASIGVFSLAAGGLLPWGKYWSVWLTWWIGDALGSLLIAPILLVWVSGYYKDFVRSNLRAIFAFICLIIASGLIFFVPNEGFFTKYPVQYLIKLILVLAAIRLGQLGATTAAVLMAAMAIIGTTFRLGPFSATASLEQDMVGVQLYNFSNAVLLLVLGAVITERKSLTSTLEERVKERTQVLNQAQQIANMGSWEWDMVSNKVRWSDELFGIYGLSPKNFHATYEGFLERVHPDDRQRVDATIRQALSDQKSFDFFHRIVRPDGTIRTLHAKGSIDVKKDKPVRMFGTSQDVTEEKKAEALLQSKTKELEQLNKFMIGREVKMAELKNKIKKLEAASAGVLTDGKKTN